MSQDAKIAEMGKVAGTRYSTTELQIEKLRLETILASRDAFITHGIKRMMREHGEHLRDVLERTAPYDDQEIWGFEQGLYQNYHMQDHMSTKPYKDGVEVESEASYSGKLEYGTAYHGVQHIFFRPATWKEWKAYKNNVIKIMRGIFSI